MQKITVDLRDPPEDRWHLTPEQQQRARELLALYKSDLGIPPDVGEFLATAAKEFVRPDYWTEIQSIAEKLGMPVSDAVLCQLLLRCPQSSSRMYRILGVDTAGRVLHARNLDWWTKSAILSRYTTICNFVGGVAGEFTAIGWPGFTGVFSGIAPGRFSITLNAVLSLEPAVPSTPVVLVLRNLFEEARGFDEAPFYSECSVLAPSDSLLLLTGTHAGEHVVIERTLPPARLSVAASMDSLA